MSDNDSPLYSDPNGGQAPDSMGNTPAPTPAPDNSVPPSADISALNATPVNPTALAAQPSAPAQPHSGALRRLSAFLDGLTSGGGIVGGVSAALDPNRFAERKQAAQNTMAANVKFANARAAAAIAQATRDQFNAEHLPEELQDQHEQTALATVNTLKNLGLPVAAVTNHTTQSAVASLQNMAADSPNGTVGHTISVTLPSTGQTISFSTDKATVDPEMFNKTREAFGLPAIDPGVIQQMKPDQAAQMLENASSLWTTVPGDSKSAEALYAQIQNARNSYAARTPDWKSDRNQMLAKFDQRLKDVQATMSFYDARERQHALNRAAAHASAAEHIRTVDSPIGDTTDLNAKQYNQTQLRFKPDMDALQKTEQSYQMFQRAAADARKALSGQGDMSGAESVTTLFNAIGLSATPLKGMGFRINNNTVAEHANARGLGQAMYQKLLGLKAGDVITPQQVLDYANIASAARHDAYIGTIDKARSFGLKADPFLPKGHGASLDPNTAKIFLDAASGDQKKAAAAAKALRWRF